MKGDRDLKTEIDTINVYYFRIADVNKDGVLNS